MKTLTLGSLFDGIGGWQLAAVRAGIVPIWSSEIEAFPIEVTKSHFPHTLRFGGPDQQRAQFARWPRIAKCYERAFGRMIAKRKADGLPCEWKDGHDVMKWWMMQNNRAKEDDRSIPLFGMMLDETDT